MVLDKLLFYLCFHQSGGQYIGQERFKTQTNRNMHSTFVGNNNSNYNVSAVTGKSIGAASVDLADV